MDNYLCNEAEVKVFELKNPEKLIEVYVQKYRLCKEAQLKLLDLPNVSKILLKYVQAGNQLSIDAQLKMIELENSKKLVKKYTRYHTLCQEATQKMVGK